MVELGPEGVFGTGEGLELTYSPVRTADSFFSAVTAGESPSLLCPHSSQSLSFKADELTQNLVRFRPHELCVETDVADWMG